MKKKIILSGSIFLWMLCFIFVVSGRDIYAAEDRVVKVAFFPMDGYHIINEDGNYDGMDVAYLNALCEYTDWEIEYVPCDSWEEALQLLSNQKVNLVGSAQYSAERAQIYQYADLASGYTFGVIATNPESTIAYEDFTAMQQITFGMVENYVRKNEFIQYLRDHGINAPSVIEYPSTAALQDAPDHVLPADRTAFQAGSAPSHFRSSDSSRSYTSTLRSSAHPSGPRTSGTE